MQRWLHAHLGLVAPRCQADLHRLLRAVQPGIAAMNWYEHHIGDWLRKCSHLSLAEEGCYRRLLDWYYGHEAPLPLDIKAVARCARCATPADRRVLRTVLHEFFDLTPDGWRNGRVDREIEKYLHSRVTSPHAREAAAERSRVAREYRRLLFAKLRANGVVPAFSTKNEQLINMLLERGLTAPERELVTAQVTAQERQTANESRTPLPIIREGKPSLNAVTSAVTQGPDPTPPTPSPTLAGQVCRAMRVAGLIGVNPSHPELLRLLAEGATEEELTFAAAEAHTRGKGFPYALAIVAGRRRDAQRGPENEGDPANADGPRRPLIGPTSAAEALAQAWAPALSGKTPTGPITDLLTES